MPYFVQTLVLFARLVRDLATAGVLFARLVRGLATAGCLTADLFARFAL